MLRYLIKRLFYAIGVMLAVSLLVFFMSTLAPGDLVESHIALDSGGSAFRQRSYFERNTDYQNTATRLGHDLPVFYFSISPVAYPDSLHHILRKEERELIRVLTLRHGRPDLAMAYRAQILSFMRTLDARADTWANAAMNNAEFLLSSVDTGRIRFVLTDLSAQIPDDAPEIQMHLKQLESTYNSLAGKHVRVWNLMPVFRWHGISNQYHSWVSHTLNGDFGLSLIDGRPVKTKINQALRWTLRINIIAILLAFGIAIPLGVVTARRVGRRTDKLISSVLFAFYAMPSFWLAMLCIVFLTTSEYGSWLDLFPTGGVGMVTPDMSWWERVSIRFDHLMLPVLCILLGSLAYLTRQMRGSMLRELRQDYIRMARAKGLSETQVHWRHAFRNAMFPMITLIGSAFPAAISGSVILEIIFSIPGMGRLLYMSILAKDWPVVYAMVLLATILTVIGYLIADLLYRTADPRVVLQRTAV